MCTLVFVSPAKFRLCAKLQNVWATGCSRGAIAAALCVLDTPRSSAEEDSHTRAIRCERRDSKSRTRKVSDDYTRRAPNEGCAFPENHDTCDSGDRRTGRNAAQTESGESSMSARKDLKTLMKRPFMRARLMNGCGVR